MSLDTHPWQDDRLVESRCRVEEIGPASTKSTGPRSGASGTDILDGELAPRLHLAGREERVYDLIVRAPVTMVRPTLGGLSERLVRRLNEIGRRGGREMAALDRRATGRQRSRVSPVR